MEVNPQKKTKPTEVEAVIATKINQLLRVLLKICHLFEAWEGKPSVMLSASDA